MSCFDTIQQQQQKSNSKFFYLIEMEEIIDYQHEEDYYSILGCDELSSTEQIVTEYKARVLHCHPDKHPDNQAAARQFERIQAAKDVLCDVEKRQNYDKWRRSGIAVPYSRWCSMRDNVHTSMHWATPKKACMLECGDPTFTATTTAGQTVMANTGKYSQSGSSDHMLDSSDLPSASPWQRGPSSDILNKFRNYEI